MKKYGLIGKKLGHSWSKKWFEELFAREKIVDAEYLLYEMPTIDDLPRWAVAEGMQGFNVTIPYKEEIIPLLDHLDKEAAAISAVNCVEVVGDKLIGHNTDAPAFAQTLQPFLKPWHTRALILGTGGASKAVAYVLHEKGIDFSFVSRSPQNHPFAISYSDAITQSASTFLIINCTPVGMYPNTNASPWPNAKVFGNKHLCYDLIYNPLETRFLQEALNHGATVTNGLSMLERQAQLSWQIWNDDFIA